MAEETLVGNPVWVGDKLWYLLNLTTAELMERYPQYTQGGLKGKKSYWRSKLSLGEITMPPKPVDGNDFSDVLKLHNLSPQLAKEFTEQGFHVGYIKNKEGEIEYTIPLPHAKGNIRKSPEELAELYPPVEPAIIHPTKLIAEERPYKMLIVYGDGQVDFRRRIDPVTDEMELIPLHNIPMHNIIQQINAEYQPEYTVNLGDFADMSALSHFDKDSDHFHKTLGPSLRWIHNFYAQMRADNPKATHVEVSSNHEVRIKKQVLRNIEPLYDLVLPGEDYPVLSYYRMANLGKLDIHFVSGYGAAEFVYGDTNPIIFKHGVFTSSNPGATVRKEAASNPTVNIIRGHGHSDEEVRQTTRDGKQLFYKMLGSSCMNDGPVPGYHSAVDDHNYPVKFHNSKHQNTFAVIEDYGEGRYQLITIDVVDGVAYFKGRVYDGNI